MSVGHGKPQRGCSAQAFDLSGGDRCFGRAVGRAGAVSHFNEHDVVAILHDQVDLTNVVVSVVPRDQDKLFPLEVLLGDVLGIGADVGRIHGVFSEFCGDD